jgi:electron transfer flavoprotein beta subunit
MHILVCLKQILDPDVPSRDFKIDPERKEAVRGSANLVTNIFCENAIETALQFREKHGGKITALSFGPASAEDVLRKALALKADDAIHVTSPVEGALNPMVVAVVLAAAIRKVGGVDIVMVGRESGDWGAGQTGGLLAEELGLPSISFVDHLEPAGAGLKVRRQTELGREVFEAAAPVLLTITNDDKNVPRIPKTKDVMMSFKKPLTKWSLEDVGLNSAALDATYYEVAELALPEQKAKCEFVAGDSLDERVANFAAKIAAVLEAI